MEHLAHFNDADLNTTYADARRVYRKAWRDYQAADGLDCIPAMDAWIAADREVKRIEALFSQARKEA